MIYAGSRELYETVSYITEFKNKSGFAMYYHMKLLLIFRKYRERYFLHNKKRGQLCMTRHTEKCSRFGLLVLTLHDLQDPSCFHRKKMIRDLSAVRVLQALEIFYLFSCELAVVTAHKSPKSDIADGHPFQLLDFIAYSGEHLADLLCSCPRGC